MDAVEEAEALHEEVRRAIASLGPTSEAAYETLAHKLAVFQARHVPGYARLLGARTVDVRRAEVASLPAVPTDAFRVTRVATFPSSLDVATFRTSGTTGSLAGRGAHPMRTLETYRLAALTWAKETLFQPFRAAPQNGMNIHSASTRRATVVAISPPPAELRDSSLVQMMAWFVDELGAEGSRFVSPEDARDAMATLRSLAGGTRPVVVLATAFAWVHLVDALAGETIALPAGSRAMQTGGFKGRSRELSKSELRAAIAHGLGLPEREVVGEYGMTELTSQLYGIAEPAEGDARWMYRAPPWVRVRACDPVSLAPMPVGARGIARIEDLGNIESAWAIQTADEVIVHADGEVELLGRLPGATPRGCSLAVEELLTRVAERAS